VNLHVINRHSIGSRAACVRRGSDLRLITAKRCPVDDRVEVKT